MNKNKSLSYGEMITISDEWNKWKQETKDNSADNALDFIEKVCSEVYKTEDEQNEIFSLISGIEEA